MKILTRKNYLQVTALLTGFGFVFTAFSAPPGSPYAPGDTLAPTCAPGDSNCTVDPPFYNGVSEAWIGATEAASQRTSDKTLRSFHVENTDTSTTTGWVPLNMFDVYIAPSGNHAAGVTREALAGYATVPATNTNSIHKVQGIDGGAENYGTGAINSLYGLVGWGYNAANATVQNVVGGWSGAESDAGTVANLMALEAWTGTYGGTVTDAYGINIYHENSGGTVTNRYGVYIQQFAGTATNDYGIYQQGGNQKNHLGGKLGLGGVTDPKTSLHTNDDINIQQWGNYGAYNFNTHWNGAGYARTQAGYSSQIQQDAAGHLVFGVGSTGPADAIPTWITPLFIKHATGYIGIGTATPKSPLEVSGHISIVHGTNNESIFYNSYFDASDKRIRAGYAGITKLSAGRMLFRTAVTGAADSTITWLDSLTLDIDNDSVGIGTSTADDGKLEVKGGTVCVDTNSDDSATSCITTESDIRLKKNLVKIESALEKISKLNGYEFDWRWDEFDQVKRFEVIPHDIGVIAQEVELIFPEAMGEEFNGFKTVDYRKLVAPLIEAVKELSEKYNHLEEQNALLIDLVCLDHPNADVCSE